VARRILLPKEMGEPTKGTTSRGGMKSELNWESWERKVKIYGI
jgi:hypothetical protein